MTKANLLYAMTEDNQGFEVWHEKKYNDWITIRVLTNDLSYCFVKMTRSEWDEMSKAINEALS